MVAQLFPPEFIADIMQAGRNLLLSLGLVLAFAILVRVHRAWPVWKWQRRLARNPDVSREEEFDHGWDMNLAEPLDGEIDPATPTALLVHLLTVTVGGIAVAWLVRVLGLDAFTVFYLAIGLIGAGKWLFAETHGDSSRDIPETDTPSGYLTIGERFDIRLAPYLWMLYLGFGLLAALLGWLF